jgi:hypothetical protein
LRQGTKTRRGVVALAAGVVVVALAITLVAVNLSSHTAPDASTNSGRSPLIVWNPTFSDSSFAVVPGTQVGLHWSGGTVATPTLGVHYVVTSSLPQFSSSSVVEWPPGASPSPQWEGKSWKTWTTALAVTIPKDAAAGSHYEVSLTTCDSKTCAHGSTVVKLNVPPPPTKWVTESYSSDFSKVSTFPTPGQPFATTFLDSDDSIWNASEFSHDVIEIPPTANSALAMPVASPSGAQAVFQQPFADCATQPCKPGSVSALSEHVITSDGWVWITFGGWREWAGESLTSMPPNHSEIVGYDPTTKNFCTYLVPGDNNQVAGIAATGTAPNSLIWFVESRGPTGDASLDAFNPSQVGGGCDGSTNQVFALPQSVRLLDWPSSGGQWPVQIAVDPSSPTLWITNFNPLYTNGKIYSEIDRVDISNPMDPVVVHRYQYPNTNASSLFGGKPWSIVAPPDSDYVYAMDNGDAEVIRINKVTNRLQEVPIPLSADIENGFGLAVHSDRLYFTLADDSTLNFGVASTFGYIDLSSWPDDSPPKKGVLYTGLDPVTDPTGRANYRAIAAGPTGEIAITDQTGMIRLIPRR